MGARLRLKAGKDISGLPALHPEDLPGHEALRADRGRQRQRHVRLRRLRHALGQRRAEPRVPQPDRRATSRSSSSGWNPQPAPAPIVAAASPASGTTAGGTAVAVSGLLLPGRRHRGLRRHALAPRSIVDRSTRVIAVSPAHAAGAVSVTVRNPDTRTGTLAGGFTYCAGARPAPAITAPLSVAVNSTANAASVVREPGQRLQLDARRGHDHRRPGHEPDRLRRRPAGNDDDAARERHLRGLQLRRGEPPGAGGLPRRAARAPVPALRRHPRAQPGDGRLRRRQLLPGRAGHARADGGLPPRGAGGRRATRRRPASRRSSTTSPAATPSRPGSTSWPRAA